MYSNRYERSKPNPVSLTAAIGINAVLVGALLFSAPDIATHIEKSFTGYDVPITPPPEPVKPEPVKEMKATTSPREPLIVTPIPEVPTLPPVNPTVGTVEIPNVPPVDLGSSSTGAGTGPVVTPDPPKPAPIVIGAEPDPRATFQPDYPPAERRLGNEGTVTVRVLVGTDGRVKAVERVRAENDAFYDATRRQALSRWRFRPATRDGVPYETWRTMTVRFVLQDG
ncbi:TonB family protein [Sphingomonas floccifaciens]|uniref:TonB family protein n=1 Tax=Sphingomonas floccifaciens TaxID=1844115 RepID=A0ABW4NHQ8_9SPHN